MTKLIVELIKVHLAKDSIPDAFIWRKRVYRITEVLNWWREPAEWWKGKSVRLCFRVDAKRREEWAEWMREIRKAQWRD